MKKIYNKNLAAAMTEKNITVQELAALTGMTERTVISYRYHERSIKALSYKKLALWAEVLGVSIDYLTEE